MLYLKYNVISNTYKEFIHKGDDHSLAIFPPDNGMPIKC